MQKLGFLVVLAVSAACAPGKAERTVQIQQAVEDTRGAYRIIDAVIQKASDSPVYELILVDDDGKRMGLTLSDAQVVNVYVRPELDGTYVKSFVYRIDDERYRRYTSVFVQSEPSKAEWQKMLDVGRQPFDVRPRAGAQPQPAEKPLRP